MMKCLMNASGLLVFWWMVLSSIAGNLAAVEADFTLLSVSFSTEQPWHLAVAEDGSLLATELRKKVVCKYQPDGEPDLTFGDKGVIGNADTDGDGNPHGIGDGEFSGADRYKGPTGIAVDEKMNVYVADERNSRIMKFSKNGKLDVSFGKRGAAGINEDRNGDRMMDAGGGNGEFRFPGGVAYHEGNLYVADLGNKRWQKIDSQTGEWKGGGKLDGMYPYAIAVDGKGFIYVAGGEYSPPHLVCKVVKLAPDGATARDWGKDGVLGGAFGEWEGQFKSVTSLAVDADGCLVVSDGGNRRLQVFDPNGRFVCEFEPLSHPARIGGIALGPERRIYVSEFSGKGGFYHDRGVTKVYRMRKF
ncbi:MAG: NHL repeat-containing protein [Verrucomicrobiae bacterium]|nr:NHL repeat-containing protein [Verrucomicrobiae bacterium]